MTTHEYRNLRINRVDAIAAEQSGLPSLFYTIKRCYGDDEASSYLRAHQLPSAQTAASNKSTGWLTAGSQKQMPLASQAMIV